jgi:hypothetical protein
MYSQEWNPKNVLDKGREESLMPESILEYRVREVTADGEHKADTDPDFETSEIVSVGGKLPTKKEVVEEREDERSSDAIIREHVRHHTDLVMNGCGGPNELVKLGGDRTLSEPFNEWIKNELGATVSIFFLSRC